MPSADNNFSLDLILHSEVQKLLDNFASVMRIHVMFYGPQGQVLRQGRSEGNCRFCQLMQNKFFSLERCLRLDQEKQALSRATGKCQSYLCHAHLWEAIMPVVSDGKLLGKGSKQNGTCRTQKGIPRSALSFCGRHGKPDRADGAAGRLHRPPRTDYNGRRSPLPFNCPLYRGQYDFVFENFRRCAPSGAQCLHDLAFSPEPFRQEFQKTGHRKTSGARGTAPERASRTQHRGSCRTGRDSGSLLFFTPVQKIPRSHPRRIPPFPVMDGLTSGI